MMAQWPTRSAKTENPFVLTKESIRIIPWFIICSLLILQHFLAGEFSVADIGFVPRLLVLNELGIDAGMNRANVEAWIKRLLDRPSVQNLKGVTAAPLAGV